MRVSYALNQQFAYAAQKRDTFKATVDLFPMDALNMSLEYRFRRSNYDETVFGYTADTRNAASFTVDYTLKKAARFFGYFDFENRDLSQRALLGSDGWVSEQDEKTYAYGVRADVYAIPKKLTFVLQYDYMKSDGFNDFDVYERCQERQRRSGRSSHRYTQIGMITRNHSFTLYGCL